MKRRERPLFKRNEMDKTNYNGLFAIRPILSQIVIIAIIFGIYSYINAKGYFPHWKTYIYYGIKGLIAAEVLIAATKSLTGPLLAMLIGGVTLYLFQTNALLIISTNDSWQLIIIGAVACLLTLVIRSFKVKKVTIW